MIKLFTHTDLDGVGCAVLAKIAFGESVDIEYCDYDVVDKCVTDCLIGETEYDKFIITDISISETLAKLIYTDKALREKFVLLDHHPTAVELNEFSFAIVQIKNKSGIKTSGTEMFYEWLFENDYISGLDSIIEFVYCVRNYDTWRWKEIENGFECKKMNDLFHIIGKDEFIKRCVNRFELASRICEFSVMENFILDMRQKEIDDYIATKNGQMIVYNIFGYNAGVVFGERFVSELGNRLCEMHPEIDFVMIINMGAQVVSFRTVKDIDLGKDVAAKLGGGGHPKAAGASFDKSDCIKVVNMIAEKGMR